MNQKVLVIEMEVQIELRICKEHRQYGGIYLYLL